MPDQTSDAGDMAVAGNLVVADGARLRGNLRCEGHARLGKGATIEGDVDVTGSLGVRAGVRIAGAVRCASQVDWHREATAESFACAGPFRIDGEAVAASLVAPEGIAPALEEESA